MKRKTLLERLDDMVRWTGIPAFASGRPQRRQLRWTPTVALVFAFTGLLIGLVNAGGYWIGYALLMLGFSIANFVPMFGPIKPFNGSEKLDEREREQRRSAFLLALAAVSVSTWLGLWLLVALSTLGNWDVEHLTREMMALGFFGMVIYSTVPTLFANWQYRALDDE